MILKEGKYKKETDDDDVQIGGQMVGQGSRSDFLLGHAVESVVLPALFVLFGFRVLPLCAVGGVVRRPARKQLHRLHGRALAVAAMRNGFIKSCVKQQLNVVKVPFQLLIEVLLHSSTL